MPNRPNTTPPLTLATDPRAAAPASADDFETRDEFARFLVHIKDLECQGVGPKSLRAWLDLAEAWRITQALQECRGNRSAAARLLGIGRRTLYAKMDKLDITPNWSL